MILNLSDLSSESLQSQIIRQIRARVLAGELAANTSLPSIRALAREQRVSVITVQRAYESLVHEGLIHSRRGKGFFVSALKESAKTQMALQRLQEELTPLIQFALDEGLTIDEIKGAIETIITRHATND